MTKNKFDKILIGSMACLGGVAIGMIVTLYISTQFDACYNNKHDDEYVQRLIKDNIMLDRVVKDMRQIIEENE